MPRKTMSQWMQGAFANPTRRLQRSQRTPVEQQESDIVPLHFKLADDKSGYHVTWSEDGEQKSAFAELIEDKDTGERVPHLPSELQHLALLGLVEQSRNNAFIPVADEIDLTEVRRAAETDQSPTDVSWLLGLGASSEVSPDDGMVHLSADDAEGEESHSSKKEPPGLTISHDGRVTVTVDIISPELADNKTTALVMVEYTMPTPDGVGRVTRKTHKIKLFKDEGQTTYTGELPEVPHETKDGKLWARCYPSTTELLAPLPWRLVWKDIEHVPTRKKQSKPAPKYEGDLSDLCQDAEVLAVKGKTRAELEGRLRDLLPLLERVQTLFPKPGKREVNEDWKLLASDFLATVVKSDRTADEGASVDGLSAHSGKANQNQSPELQGGDQAECFEEYRRELYRLFAEFYPVIHKAVRSRVSKHYEATNAVAESLLSFIWNPLDLSGGNSLTSAFFFRPVKDTIGRIRARQKEAVISESDVNQAVEAIGGLLNQQWQDGRNSSRPIQQYTIVDELAMLHLELLNAKQRAAWEAYFERVRKSKDGCRGRYDEEDDDSFGGDRSETESCSTLSDEVEAERDARRTLERQVKFILHQAAALECLNETGRINDAELEERREALKKPPGVNMSWKVDKDIQIVIGLMELLDYELISDDQMDVMLNVLLPTRDEAELSDDDRLEAKAHGPALHAAILIYRESVLQKRALYDPTRRFAEAVILEKRGLDEVARKLISLEWKQSNDDRPDSPAGVLKHLESQWELVDSGVPEELRWFDFAVLADWPNEVVRAQELNAALEQLVTGGRIDSKGDYGKCRSEGELLKDWTKGEGDFHEHRLFDDERTTKGEPKSRNGKILESRLQAIGGLLQAEIVLSRADDLFSHPERGLLRRLLIDQESPKEVFADSQAMEVLSANGNPVDRLKELLQTVRDAHTMVPETHRCLAFNPDSAAL